MLLSNRSAAYAVLGDWTAALADADAVINYKRPWSKGHFRKAKALQGLGEYEEAKVALALGLAFEPSNVVSIAVDFPCMFQNIANVFIFFRKCCHS